MALLVPDVDPVQPDRLVLDFQVGTVSVCSGETMPDHAVLSNYSQRWDSF